MIFFTPLASDMHAHISFISHVTTIQHELYAIGPCLDVQVVYKISENPPNVHRHNRNPGYLKINMDYYLRSSHPFYP